MNCNQPHASIVDIIMHSILELLMSQMEAAASEAEEVETKLAALDKATIPLAVPVALQSVQAMFRGNVRTLQGAIDSIEEALKS
jgi:hypothetical protein